MDPDPAGAGAEWLSMLRPKLAVAACFLSLGGCLWALPAKSVRHFEPVRIVSTAETLYPAGSTASGTVILEVMVEETGKVGLVQVVRGVPQLTEAAERSVRQWKFEPARLDGQRVAAPVLAAFSFNLSLPSSSGPDRFQTKRKEPLPYEPIRIISTAPANNPSADVAFGYVTLQVVVDATGAARAVKVMDGIPVLAAEAERSVREWKFRPAQFAGAPLATPMVASFVFSDLPPAQCSHF